MTAQNMTALPPIDGIQPQNCMDAMSVNIYEAITPLMQESAKQNA